MGGMFRGGFVTGFKTDFETDSGLVGVEGVFRFETGDFVGGTGDFVGGTLGEMTLLIKFRTIGKDRKL
jgi:hypothetical protein